MLKVSKKQPIKSNIIRSDKSQFHYLSDETSVICTGDLPLKLHLSNDEYQKLWDIHPEERGKIKLMDIIISTPRWTQSYFMNYNFSGLDHPVYDDIPNIVKPHLKFVNDMKIGPGEFNQCLINWYGNGHDYIGEHSDDESQLLSNSPILGINFGTARKLRIRSKTNKLDKIDFMMGPNSFYIMMGQCQKNYKHGIVKIGGKKGENTGSRISLTFRQFDPSLFY